MVSTPVKFTGLGKWKKLQVYTDSEIKSIPSSICPDTFSGVPEVGMLKALTFTDFKTAKIPIKKQQNALMMEITILSGGGAVLCR